MVRRAGVTIVEVLVVVGVLSIVVSLVIPQVAASRGRAMAMKSMSNMRSLGIALSEYSGMNMDRVPAFGQPTWPPGQAVEFDFGALGDGYWFANFWMYAIEITAFLGDPAVAAAPGNPAPPKVWEHHGSRVSLADYALSQTLYAAPAFFNWDTMVGVPQWRAQRLTDVRHPSSKGIMLQNFLFHYPQYGVVPGCCALDIPSPVLFGDLSASEHDLRAMPAGVANPFVASTRHPASDPTGQPGPPVMNTLNGIEGTDR